MSLKDYETLMQNLRTKIDDLEAKLECKNFGRVISIGDGIANVDGLEDVGFGEVVSFLDGGIGCVMDLNPGYVSVMLFNKVNELREGDEVIREGKNIKVPVGRGLLGRIIDPLGNPLDDLGPLVDVEYMPIDCPSPGIMDRTSVCEPLQTGIKVIDALIPIGLGQRQLILGDRQSGKTSIAIDTILNQKNVIEAQGKATKCIYVAIGQKNASIAKLCETLRVNGALKYSIVIVASASDPSALQYIAPAVGCTAGEYFRDKGEHSLVVFDDLSKHADAYREISLLMRRYPARGAYPGDVFYQHSRLLERAAKLKDSKGGGSMTILPIIETQRGDVTAYIPTNVISITDGQLYLDRELFLEGQRPAVNIGLSVSRIGSSAQYKAMRKIGSRLKAELSQYHEFESFSRSVSDLDQETKNALKRGGLLTKLFRQDSHKPLNFEEMVLILFAGVRGFLDDIDPLRLKDFQDALFKYIREQEKVIFETLSKEHVFGDELEEKMANAVRYFLKTF